MTIITLPKHVNGTVMTSTLSILANQIYDKIMKRIMLD